MLQLRPNCECCDRGLAPDAPGAMICSFECTFCDDCGTGRFGGACPNCGGGLQARPVRPTALLSNSPGSSKRVLRAHPGGARTD